MRLARLAHALAPRDPPAEVAVVVKPMIKTTIRCDGCGRFLGEATLYDVRDSVTLYCKNCKTLTTIGLLNPAGLI